jgi:diaminopimelate epimerase
LQIPFTKAHGARNDFLITWRAQVPDGIGDMSVAARAICDRHTGAGADGWIVLSPGGLSPGGPDYDGAIELWNADGSRSEISGNGTRCAAAVLVAQGKAGAQIRIGTGAGVKRLKLLERNGRNFSFEMNMGPAAIEELHSTVAPGRDCVVLNVGNPQCAVLCADFEFDWRKLGAALERHPSFPNRTNVSFVRVVDRHTLDVRFFERGVGETMSSGTGSTGAGASALARGLVESPVHVLTPAGPLDLRWEGADILLAGPAEIVAEGVFFFSQNLPGLEGQN